jgi:hypothetical protein
LWNADADKEERTFDASPKIEDVGHCIPLRYEVRVDGSGDRAVAFSGSFGQLPRMFSQLATWNLKTGELLANHSVEEEPRWLGNYSLCSGGDWRGWGMFSWTWPRRRK